MSGTRKERLTCALVELRDRIEAEFRNVSETWQVAAQDLRGCYSYAYPASAPGAPDPLILERACEEVMRSLRHEIRIHAEQFGVPDNLVEEVVVDWLVSDGMESPRTPPAHFIPEELVAPKTASGDANPKDMLPSAMRLMAAKRRGEIGSPSGEQSSGLAGEPQRLLPETAGEG